MKIEKSMIDPKYYEELGIFPDEKEELQRTREGGIGKGGISQYMEYPTQGSKRNFVMQHHWRGRSVHVDFRMEVNDHLVGWTLLDTPPGTEEVTSIPEALKMLKKLDWKFQFAKQNKGIRAETKCKSEICDEWMYNIKEKDNEWILYKKPDEELSELEELARQPKEWLRVQGILKPGEVGATKEKVGVISIIEKGTFWEGTQKPYFHEYFVKTVVGNLLPKGKWVRIIMRGIRVPKIDPQTKRAIKGQYEMMWRCMIPSDQIAYALKRGIKKKWKPPKGVIPIPPDQRKGELWEKWQAYMRGEEPEKKSEKEEKERSLEELPFAGYKNFADCVRKCKTKGKVTDCNAWCAAIARRVGEIPSKEVLYCEDCLKYETCVDYSLPDQSACNNFKEISKEKLAKGRFTLHFHSWMGQIVVRAIPHIEYYLRLEQDGKIRSWHIDGNPTRITNMAATYEGKVHKKWMTFEGKIKPGQPYNPTKTLVSQMIIIDTGEIIINEKIEEGKKILMLSFRGKRLKGPWILEQEEKGSDMYTFKKGEAESLIAGEFVLHRHYWDDKEHWDIRVKLSKEPKRLIEWNLWKNPLEVEEEQPIRALVKECKEPEKWFMKTGKKIEREVYGKKTFIDVLDSGIITIIEHSGGFMSMKFKGNKLIGYWILKTRSDGKWFFEKAKLPEPHDLSGEPKTGNYYKPFLKEEKRGWDYYWVRIYDIKGFTICVRDWKPYLPKLVLPNYIEDVLICLYFRPGTFHGARVTAVKVKGTDTDFNKVSSWIKTNKLHTFDGTIIRGKRTKEEKFSIPLPEIEKTLKEAGA